MRTPETTLPNLLCHTITDAELDLLTDGTATVLGGIGTTAFGAALTSIFLAWPAMQALAGGTSASATPTDYLYLVVFTATSVTFLVCGFLSGIHQLRKRSKARRIRARPKMPNPPRGRRGDGAA